MNSKSGKNPLFVKIKEKRKFYDKLLDRLADKIARRLLLLGFGKENTDVKGDGRAKVMQPHDLEINQKKIREEEARKEQLPHPIERSTEYEGPWPFTE